METKCSVNSGYTLSLQRNLNSFTLKFGQFPPILLPPSFKTMHINQSEPLSLKLVETTLSLKTSISYVFGIKMVFLTMIFDLSYDKTH